MAVRVTGVDDARRAAEVLALAFHEEPLTLWQFPDPAVRTQTLPQHFAAVVTLTQNIGEVWRSDGFDAVACWVAPNRWPPSEDELTAAGMAALAELVGAEAWQRFATVYAELDRAHESCIQQPHWDLWVVGVVPEARGRGAGTALIQHMLDRVDAAREAVYLETLDEATLPLYRRLGFEVVVQGVEPTSGLGYWCALRPPSASGTGAAAVPSG